MRQILFILLYPFSLIYALVVGIRNQLYDKGLWSSTQFPIPIICVGNLRVGGTGKTPHVIAILKMLAEKKPAVLSRGYGRKTKGYVASNSAASVKELGDEPWLISRELPEVPVVACENRVEGADRLRQEFPHVGAIVMDDGLQHRAIDPGLKILLTEYAKPFYKDTVLPAGRLREGKSQAKRVDVVIVTKCPSLTSQQMQEMAVRVDSHTQGHAPVYFSTMQNKAPIKEGSRVVLVAGLADNESFFEEWRDKYDVVKELSFSDHHKYGASEIDEIQKVCSQQHAFVLTTAKDIVKIKPLWLQRGGVKGTIFMVNQEVVFLEKQEEFTEMIKTFGSSK